MSGQPNANELLSASISEKLNNEYPRKNLPEQQSLHPLRVIGQV